MLANGQIHLNCVCNTVELMLESISLVRVRLLFGTNYRLKFLMRLHLLRLLQSFARAIYLVICYRLQIVYCRLGIDLSVRVPVYTFACTYFYSLIVCSMSNCCVKFIMNKNIRSSTVPFANRVYFDFFLYQL